MCKSIYISSSKFYVYFIRKNLLFLFYTITFIKHPHQFIYFIRYFNKIFILLNFFIISHNYHFNTCTRSLSFITHFSWTGHLSLSLSLKNYRVSLFLFHCSPGPFFTDRSRSFLHLSIHKPSSDDPDPFFTGRSTNQAPATQILSSPADPRTKLNDQDPFSTGRSTNQARRPKSFLHRPIHEPSSGDLYPFFTGDPYLSVALSVWVCLCVGVFLCWFICVNVFVCIWGKQDEELRLLCTEKREKNWCEWKLIK